MPIFAIGLNHKTAPLDLREALYIPMEKIALYVQDLLSRGVAREAVILSTCNRSELYAEADDLPLLQEWLLKLCSDESVHSDLLNAFYVYWDLEAVIHLMEVASGIDSMVLGEPQILGQIKEAYSESCSAGSVGPVFHRLFQQVFAVAKNVRTTTAIGACPVSVVSAAVKFAKQKLPGFSNANVVLLGAGETSQLFLRYLASESSLAIAIVNRTREKSEKLKYAPNAVLYDFAQLNKALLSADVVFSATSSPYPLLTHALMVDIMQQRQNKSLMLIDVAVPRNIEPEAGKIASLYCIDDLRAIIDHNLQGREHAAVKAREMIRENALKFMREREHSDDVSDTIRTYRGQMEALCTAELFKAKELLQRGHDPELVLHLFADAITKKWLHVPSVQLRQAGAAGQLDLLKFAKQLFAINDPENQFT